MHRLSIVGTSTVVLVALICLVAGCGRTGSTIKSSDLEPDTAIDRATTVELFELCTNNRQSLMDQIRILEVSRLAIFKDALPLPEVSVSDLDFDDVDGSDFMEPGKDYSPEELEKLRLRGLERMNEGHIETALKRKAESLLEQEIITELRAVYNEWRDSHHQYQTTRADTGFDLGWC